MPQEANEQHDSCVGGVANMQCADDDGQHVVCTGFDTVRLVIMHAIKLTAYFMFAACFACVVM